MSNGKKLMLKGKFLMLKGKKLMSKEKTFNFFYKNKSKIKDLKKNIYN